LLICFGFEVSCHTFFAILFFFFSRTTAIQIKLDFYWHTTAIAVIFLYLLMACFLWLWSDVFVTPLLVLLI